MEIKSPVNVVMVDMKCDSCGTGTFHHNGTQEEKAGKTMYAHICDNPECGDVALFEKVYPFVEFVPKKFEFDMNKPLM